MVLYNGTLTKTPNEKKDFVAEFLNSDPDITYTINSVTVVATRLSDGVDVTSSVTIPASLAYSGDEVQVWTDNGTADEDYRIQIIATMTGSPARELEQNILLKVRD